jgi:MFS family permease
MGVLFVLPLYLQQLRGISALQSGLTTFPQALGMIAIVPFSTRLYTRIGPRRMMIPGMLGLAVTTAGFMLVGLHTDLWWIRGLMVARGLMLGIAMVPMQTATFATIKSQDTGRASALMNTNRQVGGSFGVAILATILSERVAAHVPPVVAAAAGQGHRPAQVVAAQGTLLAYHDVFFAAALLSLVGAAFAFLIHDSRRDSRRGCGANQAPARLRSGSGPCR